MCVSVTSGSPRWPLELWNAPPCVSDSGAFACPHKEREPRLLGALSCGFSGGVAKVATDPYLPFLAARRRPFAQHLMRMSCRSYASAPKLRHPTACRSRISPGEGRTVQAACAQVRRDRGGARPGRSGGVKRALRQVAEIHSDPNSSLTEQVDQRGSLVIGQVDGHGFGAPSG